MNKVGIVILNWNGKNHLQTFLPSVVTHSRDVSIVVIDNHSSDDSVSFIQKNYPQIELVHNRQNGGFAKGYNEGLEQIKGKFEYYVLLNSDVEVTPNWIEPIIKLMEEDETVSACQPKVLSYTNKNLFEHAGACGGFMDKNAYPFCRGRIFKEIEKDEHQYDTIKEIFWATGACMFVRSSSFHELGGFDEDYFAHMEEIDLCWRMKLHAHKIMVNPNSIVYHLGGGTLNYMSPRKVYLNFRNSLFTLYKNYRGDFLVIKMAWRFCLDYIASVAFVLNGDFKAAWQVLKAQAHFLSKLEKMKTKRRALKVSSKSYVSNRTGIYNKSVVFSSFIKGKNKYSELEENYFESNTNT